MSTTKREFEERRRIYDRLQALGVTYEHCEQLRRISMTLRRWHELECGDGNESGSWTVTRGRNEKGAFIHDDDGAPFLEHHHYKHGHGKDTVTYNAMPDREGGARKRLAKIMANYPALTAYVQGDPRGAALHILQVSDIPADSNASDCYSSRGIAIY